MELDAASKDIMSDRWVDVICEDRMYRAGTASLFAVTSLQTSCPEKDRPITVHKMENKYTTNALTFTSLDIHLKWMEKKLGKYNYFFARKYLFLPPFYPYAVCPSAQWGDVAFNLFRINVGNIYKYSGLLNPSKSVVDCGAEHFH